MFPQIFGKFVLEREIAHGGMARVYQATLRGTDGFEKRLVVKQIRPELASDDAFVARFVEEAKTAVELSHPNIVPVYELGVEQGTYYIAMELCEGVTLAEVLAETGPLPPAIGAHVGAEICRALDYAHRRAGVVHRDVTPRNVLIDEEGAVRLIDFGIAAPALGPGERAPGRQEVFGSPGHMPPEQLRGDVLTPAADVFAAAALLVEAWTGTPPFRRATASESEQALLEPVASVGDAIPELGPVAPLIARALSPDPGARPARAEDLARGLRELAQTTDLGDLARELGRRASVARGRGRASRPWLDAAPPQPASTPRLAAPGPASRAFATRDELAEWTRRLPLDEAPRERDATPASAAPRPSAGSARREGDSRRTPPSGTRAAGPGWRLVAVMLFGVVVSGVVTVRWLGQGSVGQAGSGVAATPSAAPPRAASSGPEPALAVAQPSAEAPAAGRSAVASAAVARGGSTLALTGAPPLAFRVAGRAGTTPATLALPPGTHRVTLRSAALGEERSLTVRLEPGETRAVHGDFTGDRPRILLLR
ncbi:MAG: protein kinase [Polyangiaceae bacterium]|nr:protein kinase [Polyangiaceae bacterium]